MQLLIIMDIVPKTGRESESSTELPEITKPILTPEERTRIISDYRLDILTPEERSTVIREYNRIKNIRVR